MTKAPYKSLLIWQKGMSIAKLVYQVTSNFPKSEEFGLKSQMRRSSVSVPSNIAEGSQRGTDPDFAYFIRIAKGSLAELETQVILAKDLDFFDHTQNIALLLESISELDKMMYAFHKSLSSPN